MAGLFQVLWGTADKGFKKASVLKGTDGEPLIIPLPNKDAQVENICTRPTAVDWDGDGDLDLVVGNFAGSFYLFRGEGKGKFAPKPEPIESNGSPLKINGVHSDPVVVDWDGDGDLDLLSGSNMGGVHWAENQAGKGKTPDLKPFTTLIKMEREIEYGQPLQEADLAGPTTSTRIWVDDVNDDGKLDILVGDSVTLISAGKGLTKEQFAEQQAKWNEDWQAVVKQLGALSQSPNAKEKPDKEALAEQEKQRRELTAKYQKLYEQRKKFIQEERTGFVWLYVQK